MVIGTTKKLARKKKLAEQRAPIVNVVHDRYLIKAGWLNGRFIARAFPKASSRTQGLIAEATGDTESAAIANLKEMIRERIENRKSERRWDETANAVIPKQAEFAEALGYVKITYAQAKMLKTLAACGDGGMSLHDLALAGGYKSYAMTTRNFRSLGILIADYLSLAIPGDGSGFEPRPENILIFEGDLAVDPAKRICVMHPELRDAVQAGI